MRCDNCNSEESYIKEYNHEYYIKDKLIEFKSNRRFCKKCNSLVYDAILDNEAGMKAIDIYNQKYGIPKEKIIELRNNYKISQALFAKILGCAKKTLISYEKGTSIPNDNFAMTINSLLLNPSIIKTFIEANKSKFTEKEYNKLHNKTLKYLGNNYKGFKGEDNYIPTEYNGYTKLNKEKIINMILFFALNCVNKTKLLKEMFYADFYHFKKTGASITGLEYAKIPLGPVPDNYENILNECIEKEKINYITEFKNDYEYHIIKSLVKVDESIFSKEELDIINNVNKYFENYSSKDIVTFSHEEKAFKETDIFKNISYEYAFDLNNIINN